MACPRAIAHDPFGLVIIDWSMLVRSAWDEDCVSKVAPVVLGKLWQILSDPMPPSIAIAVDPERVDPLTGIATRRQTWRDKATNHLPEKDRYKAGRIPKPPELVKIEHRLLEVVQALRITRLIHENPAAEQDFDADDAMATGVRLARAEGRSVAVMTDDKDMLQCVTDEHPCVIRWWPFLTDIRREKGELDECDEQGVMRKLSVMPNQVADYLAMMGDSADNVPGVKGIGKKTAAELLFAYGSLDAALAAIEAKLAHIRSQPNKITDFHCPACGLRAGHDCLNGQGKTLVRPHKERKEAFNAFWQGIDLVTTDERKLYEGRESAIASRSLVRLWDHAPIRWDPQRQMTGGFDVRRLRELLRDFGFTRMAGDLPSFPKPKFDPLPLTY